MSMREYGKKFRPGNLPEDTPAGPQKGKLKNGILSRTTRHGQDPG